MVNRLFYLVVRSIYKAVVNWWFTGSFILSSVLFIKLLLTGSFIWSSVLFIKLLLTGSFIWSSVLFIKLLLTGGLPALLFGRPFYL